MNKSRRIALGWTLHRYIVLDLVRPTLIAFGGLTALLLLAELFGFSDLLINRGFGASAIGQLLFFKIIILGSRTLPFATLVGTLVGLGRVKADLEILALQASGVSRRQLAGPVFIFATALTGAGLGLTLTAAPWAHRSLNSLQETLAHAGTLLRPGETYTFGQTRLLAREVSSSGHRLYGIVLWTPEQDSTFLAGQTIFAEHAEVQSNSTGSITLLLTNGLTLSPIRGEGGSTRFQTFRTSLEHPADQPSSSSDDQIQKEQLGQAALSRLAQLGWSAPERLTDRRLVSLAQAELHRRFSSPFACLVLGLLAAPIVLLSQSFSRAAGGVSGLLITVVYYGLVQFGDGLAQTGLISPGLGVWSPNILVGALALFLLWSNEGWLQWRGQSARHIQSARTIPSLVSTHTSHKRFLLQRHVARSYLHMLLVSFGFLFVGYFLVDMLERLQWFARYQAGFSEIVRFYGARSPLLASRMIPMALLLATALTVGVLALNRELIGMRACGVSVVRALSPIVLIAGLSAAGYLLLNEAIVPRTNALADWLKMTEIKPQSGLQVHPLAMWHQNGKLYHTRQLDIIRKRATDMSIFELDEAGLPSSRTDARTARHIGEGIWELDNPIQLYIHNTSFEIAPAYRYIQLGTEPKTSVDTMHLNAFQLARTIQDTASSGFDTTAYRVAFHMKLAAPMVCLLLPVVTLFFAVGGPPYPSPALMVFFSTLTGVGSVLISDFFASFGYGGFLPPMLAGWGPALVLLLLAGIFAVRSQGEVIPSAPQWRFPFRSGLQHTSQAPALQSGEKPTQDSRLQTAKARKIKKKEKQKRKQTGLQATS